jgi:hypothetical protein
MNTLRYKQPLSFPAVLYELTEEGDEWWEEATGEWRRLHNTELHNLYYSPDIIRT